MSVTIKVEGLRELRTALRKAERGSPRALDRGVKDAAELVANDAKRRVPMGPAAGGHARNSIRTARVVGGAEVRAGGARYPYWMWLSHGGHVGRRHNTFRARDKKGRYLYPAWLAKQAQVNRTLNRAITRALRSAGLDARGGA